MQHGGLHLEEAPRVEEGAQFAHEAGPQEEDLLDVRIAQQVQVPLAVAGLRVLESMVLFGQGFETFRQEDEAVGQEGQFICPCPE